jgi:hypothetical protein
LGYDGQLNLAILDIEDGIRRIPLRKNNVLLLGLKIVLPLPTLVRKSWRLKGLDRRRAIRVPADF